ncbi:hypothetical protein GB931_12420 [Modestobacter sp. I12A-02628]|uniref:DUF2071 domain-containing protein n=1 Tax=Goekera deserti TaxID=2497753 RepID=A0A7K3WAG6_9ACTN|nr:DUF2071 domain-containing protein [Goekera deserti]MPQ98709.1 hypothetical protein [Goekera deserti]NDI49271.1 hypothetical protein [Goekera deserti]NEL53009.1 hypothetical protein [Goekera deserti]
MAMPQMVGEVQRRLLVNYRVDPEVLQPLLPAGLRPQLVDGAGVAGICLIRLGGLHLRRLPSAIGLTTENAAHRIAVQWEDDTGSHTGVYIPRRDSDSRLTVLLGGRVFPGVHSRARFTVSETDDDLQVAFRSTDGGASVDVRVAVAPTLEGSHLFDDVAQASAFFEQGAVGWSPRRDGVHLEGIRLCTRAWRVDPGRVVHSRSSFFDDTSRFPAGSATLDCALVMRRVPVTWDVVPEPPGALATTER